MKSWFVTSAFVTPSLSQQRAEHFAALLVDHGVPAALLATLGIAAQEPWQANAPEPDPVRNRRVTFRVVLEQPATP